MNANRDTAINAVLKAEGGYVNDPNDPGGETIFGITRRDHPSLFANGLPTIEQARQVYAAQYWAPAYCDQWPAPIDQMVFNAAVNVGVESSVRFAQEVLGVAVDGKVGPITADAARRVNSQWFATRYTLRWLRYYASLSTYKFFGTGWYNRITNEVDRLMR